MIHGQFLREDQVDAINRLQIFPSLFAMHTFYWGDWHREHTLGPAPVDNISPTGWMIARGMRFSTHHDAPVAFPDSMRVLDATVTRRSRSGDIIGPDQRVDVITALKAMTIWPAWQYFEEDTKGSIEVGKLAELVILSADPTALDPETLDRLAIAQTIKEGITIYAAGQKEGRLQYRPMQDGTDPFAMFLREQTIRADLAAAGVSGIGIMNTNRMARLMATQPHDPGCVATYVTSLIGGQAAARRRFSARTPPGAPVSIRPAVGSGTGAMSRRTPMS